MTSRLQGRVALVTGGARGIGRGIVERMVAEGAAVGVLDLKLELAEEAAAAIRAAGGRAIAFGGDVAKRETLFDAAQALKAEFGKLDILVSNAMWVRYGPIEEITPEVLQRMVGTGFNSVVWGIQAAAAFMQEGGSVVNIASAAAFLGLPQGMLYCGVKAGVLGLTRSAAVDLGPRGIRVNAVAPGSVPTEGVKINVDPEKVKVRLAKTPLRRLGTVEDIASAACFLASDDSGWITGECIKVEGGVTTAFL
ncbi:MAG TPA: SDR family oxidoreductase [Ramlibacter sp.]|nr:SDR family oxidoreductase [Ramlibacter sp.]